MFGGDEMSVGGASPDGPYLSIVISSRNDDHCGNMLERMQASLNALFEQSRRYRLRTELLVVEWNRVPDRPGLSEVLSWPDAHDYCTVRFVEVPEEIHNRYDYSDLQRFYQMIAKNVGIRRARGRFILATNIDVLFSNSLFAYLASGKLTKGKLYRVDRWDVAENTPLGLPLDEQLGHCYRNVVRINTMKRTYDLVNGKNYPIYFTKTVPVHTSGCGDFQLMWRGHWHELRGYPEFHMYSIHIDSLFEYMAHYAGLEEEILTDPMVMFHISHASILPMVKTRDVELAEKVKAIREFRTDELAELAGRMSVAGRPILFNDKNWGLATDDLEDYCVVRAAWDLEFVDAGSFENIPPAAGLAAGLMPTVSPVEGQRSPL